MCKVNVDWLKLCNLGEVYVTRPLRRYYRAATLLSKIKADSTVSDAVHRLSKSKTIRSIKVRGPVPEHYYFNWI